VSWAGDAEPGPRVSLQPVQPVKLQLACGASGLRPEIECRAAVSAEISLG